VVFVQLLRLISIVMLNLSPEHVNPIMMLALRIHEIVDTRLSSNVNRNDYVRILINAQVNKLNETSESDKESFDNSKTRVQKSLTKNVDGFYLKSVFFFGF